MKTNDELIKYLIEKAMRLDDALQDEKRPAMRCKLIASTMNTVYCDGGVDGSNEALDRAREIFVKSVPL